MKKTYTVALELSELNKVLAGLYSRADTYDDRAMEASVRDDDDAAYRDERIADRYRMLATEIRNQIAEQR